VRGSKAGGMGMRVVASEAYCSHAVASDSSRLLMKRSRVRSLLVLAVMML
jgi:hypothetical protein